MSDSFHSNQILLSNYRFHSDQILLTFYKGSPNPDSTIESKPPIYCVLLMWQYIYGREREKSRLQALFKLQVFTQIMNECERDKWAI